MIRNAHCPNCAARFQFAADWFSPARGWLRCGGCKTVFHAAAVNEGFAETDFSGFKSVNSSSPPEGAELQGLPELAPQGREGSAAFGAPGERMEAPVASLSSRMDAADEVIAPPILRRALPDDADESAGLQDAADVDSASSSRHLASDADADAQRSRPVETSSDLINPGQSDFQPTAANLADVVGFDFMRDASPGRRPMRWLAWLAMPILLIALVIQITLHNRDQLVASSLALAPLVQNLCRLFGYPLAPPRQIESIVIDNTSLNRVAAGFRFALSIRNRSDIEIATPSIELTLSDTQDRPVIRRIIAPADLGAEPGIGPNGEWSGAVLLVISGSEGRIAGYRAIAFYP